MLLLQPQSLDEAVALKGEHPDALPICGGTDVMVELNFDRRRPEAIIDLTRVPELRGWSRDNGTIRLGAAVPYAQLVAELGEQLPGLALASRTVGSPQIRTRGTVAGNLGTASPAGDAIPPLVACGAQVEAVSARGSRMIPAADFIVRPKHSALEPDELIAAIHCPVARGPQQFAKIGARNAMVIAVASFALTLDPSDGSVGTGIGSAGPTVNRASDAEEFLAGYLRDDGLWASRAALDPAQVRRFGELAAAAARPIDDVRGSAAYRRHAVATMARRTLVWAWDAYRTEVA